MVVPEVEVLGQESVEAAVLTMMKRKSTKNGDQAAGKANAVVVLATMMTTMMITNLPHHINLLGRTRLIGHPDPMTHRTSHQDPMVAAAGQGQGQGQKEKEGVHEVQALVVAASSI